MKAGWADLQFSKVGNGGVDKVVDILGDFEPSAHGQLLPNGDISVGAVEQHLDGGTSDNWMFSLVQSNRDKERENLLLNNIVGDWVTIKIELRFLSKKVIIATPK